MRTVAIAPTFEAWQAAARTLLRDAVAPADVTWTETSSAPEMPSPPATASGARVPRQFIELARQAAGASDPARWQVLYAVLWRLVNEDHDLLKAGRDPQVRRLFGMAAQARRQAESNERAEALRLEAEGAGAGPFVPAGADLGALREAALRCTGCELYRHATQMVFGRGPADARIVLVGEQPGDQEDLKGGPFVGPAGEVLDRALTEVGMDRERLYVTNAVKHFKFELRGRRRIHQTPRLGEVTACRPWLEAELALIQPATLVCLGATACRALLGPDFRLMKERGKVFATRWAPRTVATLHPSAVLRGEDEAAQARLYRILIDDLRLAGG
jgi:uracil-DNA glycosylase